jgi:hypothetical protein
MKKVLIFIFWTIGFVITGTQPIHSAPYSPQNTNQDTTKITGYISGTKKKSSKKPKPLQGVSISIYDRVTSKKLMEVKTGANGLYVADISSYTWKKELILIVGVNGYTGRISNVLPVKGSITKKDFILKQQ